MKYLSKNIEEAGAAIRLSVFSAGSVDEVHAMLTLEPRDDMFADQLQRIKTAEAQLMQMPELKGAQAVFKRYFLSDATNQVPAIQETDTCTISYIQQPPLNGTKLAIWLYLQRGTDICNVNESTVVTHNGYRHIWTMGLINNTADTSYMQTWKTLFTYIDILKMFNATLEANCIRTWFFVRDVDTQYAGMVRARRENFVREGLTPQTHYIASTGIGGGPAETKALIQLGTYALTGFQPEQQQYLYAKTHLNPTYEYGVTFERGTKMTYGDRSHIFISGTASINNRGEVVHVGDIRLQTLRMWENVGALLREGGMDFTDVMHLVVYLRDMADYELVKEMYEERFHDKPYVIVHAPVCRPGWLVEMECMAVKAISNEAGPPILSRKFRMTG